MLSYRYSITLSDLLAEALRHFDQWLEAERDYGAPDEDRLASEIRRICRLLIPNNGHRLLELALQSDELLHGEMQDGACAGCGIITLCGCAYSVVESWLIEQMVERLRLDQEANCTCEDDPLQFDPHSLN
jgi:hypothetical protein